MSRESLVLVVGLILFFLPWIGIPEMWKAYAVSGLGILLAILGYFLRRKAYLHNIEMGNGERGTDSFVESRPLGVVEEENV